MPLNSTPVPFALDHPSYIGSLFIPRLANDFLLLNICGDSKNNALELLIHFNIDLAWAQFLLG